MEFLDKFYNRKVLAKLLSLSQEEIAESGIQSAIEDAVEHKVNVFYSYSDYENVSSEILNSAGIGDIIYCIQEGNILIVIEDVANLMFLYHITGQTLYKYVESEDVYTFDSSSNILVENLQNLFADLESDSLIAVLGINSNYELVKGTISPATKLYKHTITNVEETVEYEQYLTIEIISTNPNSINNTDGLSNLLRTMIGTAIVSSSGGLTAVMYYEHLGIDEQSAQVWNDITFVFNSGTSEDTVTPL